MQRRAAGNQPRTCGQHGAELERNADRNDVRGKLATNEVRKDTVK